MHVCCDTSVSRSDKSRTLGQWQQPRATGYLSKIWCSAPQLIRFCLAFSTECSVEKSMQAASRLVFVSIKDAKPRR